MIASSFLHSSKALGYKALACSFATALVYELCIKLLFHKVEEREADGRRTRRVVYQHGGIRGVGGAAGGRALASGSPVSLYAHGPEVAHNVGARRGGHSSCFS